MECHPNKQKQSHAGNDQNPHTCKESSHIKRKINRPSQLWKLHLKKSTPPSNAPSQNQVITTSITKPSNIRQNINRHPRNNLKNIPEHKFVHQLALSISTSNHPTAATTFNYYISNKKQLQEKNRCNIHSQSSRLDCLIETISRKNRIPLRPCW